MSWTAPTQNVDGTALSNLRGYRIYYGTNAGNLSQSIPVNDPAATNFTITPLTAGTYYFAVATRNLNDEESDPSSVVSKTIP